jgi:leucyl aminopeptidase
MIFNLNIKTGAKKIIYEPLSLRIRYLIDEKKLGESLAHLEKINGLKLSALQRKNFLSEEGSAIRVLQAGGKPDESIICKVKLDDKFTPDYFRNHLAGIIPSLSKEELKNLHIFLPNYSEFKNHFGSEEYYYQTFIEGIYLGNYTFDNYKSEKKSAKKLNIYLYGEDEKKVRSALNRSSAIMEGFYFARDLQNEPGNTLIPSELAKRISAGLSTHGVKVKIFNEKEIKKMNMGGLSAVGIGSDNPPRFVVIEYNGSKNKKSKTKYKKTALVGKGITFDTGGVSIKPSQNMGEMKADMSGAAVVAGTILAAAKSKMQTDILGVIPIAENMLSGRAMRPGDILKTASGKSMEVDNTDAEGRLILADALEYASNKKPDLIIDLATLTGACVVALGEFASGIFTKDEKLSAELLNLGLETYDRVWPLPMWDEYFTLLKSDVADVKNTGGRWGGAITAAKFLEYFVDKKIKWVHIDIAGPTGANNLNNYSKPYMNPAGLRLLFEYLDK